MSYNRQVPTVQAGSMADIAFLLLIFFLVATKVPNDVGLVRKLPSDCKNPPCNTPINERNILEIQINKHNNIMVEDEIIALSQLKTLVKDFMDNNGDGTCVYCKGASLSTASDNPQKAVVSLASDRHSSYERFIQVQNEITLAFMELRADYALVKFNKTEHLSASQLSEVKRAYPFNLSEATIK